MSRERPDEIAGARTSDFAQALLLVDDDVVFSDVLARALRRRGFNVETATSVDEALLRLTSLQPEFAVVDLKMAGASGLVLVEALHARYPATRILVLTGYASIATAVEAVKLGATGYLAKPASVDEICAAFERDDGDSATPVSDEPLSVDRLQWEHIQRVLADNDGNISATARALNMHRRTLQRRLAKRPTRR